MTTTQRASAMIALGLCALFAPPAPIARAQAPGPETFARVPKTPLELWDAADYLVRSGQADRAVPYLTQFLKSEPSDAVLIEIRDRYGAGSVLRLEDHPETKGIARPLLDKINAAVKKNATDPARIARFIGMLSKTHAEQDYGVDRLREAGPFAVPPLVATLANKDLPAESRALIVANMGRLDTAAVPALIAALGATDRTVGADVATVLGLIGDPRAVPFLTYPAAWRDSTALREAARNAIARITGRPFEHQARTPVRLLADEAWRYHRHEVKFAADPTELWLWDGNAPAPRQLPRTQAESILGGRLAREALALDPTDPSAQAVLLSLALEKATDRDGVGVVVSRDPSGAFAAALAAGPKIVTDVMEAAIRDGHPHLAAVSALALARVADRDATDSSRIINPLVAALSAPDRRVQYAAASAIVELNPSRPFVGSSRVVPTLARFVANRAPKALIVDGNVNRGNGVAATLKTIGYETSVVTSGDAAFREAAEATDVEIILIEPTALQGVWVTNDILTNLRADARTAGIPVFLHGPLKLRDQLTGLLSGFSRIDFVVTPTDPRLTRDLMGRRLDAMGVRALLPAERAGFAQGAAGLLATIASRPNGPLSGDLTRAEPALTEALDLPASASAAAAVLGDVPGANAQRGLARVALDPSRPAPLRFDAARNLARSIQKFGPLLTSEQEKRLVAVMDAEADTAIKGALAGVLGALRPSGPNVGARLQAYQPPRPTPAPAAGAQPTPKTDDAKPTKEEGNPTLPPAPDTDKPEKP